MGHGVGGVGWNVLFKIIQKQTPGDPPVEGDSNEDGPMSPLSSEILELENCKMSTQIISLLSLISGASKVGVGWSSHGRHMPCRAQEFREAHELTRGEGVGVKAIFFVFCIAVF